MPLLEVVQTRHVSASIRLTDTTALLLNQYAAFIGATADDVAEEAFKHVFGKDREFQEFLKTPQAQKIAHTLRIRRAPASEAAERNGKKPIAEVESTESVRAVKA